MLNKKKLNFARMSVFLTKKLSANSANNAYTLGLDGTVELGEPDIMWQTVCFIKDVQKIWTGGQIYNCSGVDVENFATKEDLEELQPAGEYLTSFTETDPVWNAEKNNYATKELLTEEINDLNKRVSNKLSKSYVKRQDIFGPPADIEGFVDLGLPSGLFWATCNIGATVPEEGGYFFKWGLLLGHDLNATEEPTEELYSNYNLFNTGDGNFDASYFDDMVDTICPNSNLAPEYDAVTATYGDHYRLPKQEDLEELMRYTRQIYTEVNGVEGFKLISNVNDNFIFIPLVGYCTGNRIFKGSVSLWSSTLETNASGVPRAFSLVFMHLGLNNDYCGLNRDSHSTGNVIRAVVDPYFTRKVKPSLVDIPTKLSDLENDAEFITSSNLEGLATLEYVESIEQVTAAALTDLLKYSIKPLANEPTDNLFVGRTYFDTTDNKQYFYTGTKWVDAMGNNKV